MESYQYHIQPEVNLFNPGDEFFDLSGFTQAVRIRKDTTQPVGTMNIVFNPARDGNLKDNITHNSVINFLKKKLKLNSVISAKIDENSKRHTFLGFIDHVYEREYAFNQSTQRTLVVNCSLLLPKLLLRDNIVNAPVLAANKRIKEALGDRVEFFGWMRGLTDKGGSVFAGKPEDAVKWILDSTPSTNTDMGSDMKPKTFFDPRKNDMDGKPLLNFQFLDGELLFSPQLSRFAGPILNYIYSCIDQAFYEVFFDTTTGEDGLAYNTMVIRPKPFSFRQYEPEVTGKVLNNWQFFEDLPEIEIDSSIRIQENLGINDYELKNFFTVNFQNSLIGSASSYMGKFGLQFPIVNLEGIKKYGLRDVALTSTLINTGRLVEEYNKNIKKGGKTYDALTASEETQMLQYLLEKREKACEWFAYPYYDGGQLTVKGSEEFTIGKRLFYKDREYFDTEKNDYYEGVHYYIQGVFQDFSFGDFWKTNLTLSRGTPENLAAQWLNEHRKKFVSVDEVISPQPTGLGLIDPEGYQEIEGMVEGIGLLEEMK